MKKIYSFKMFLVACLMMFVGTAMAQTTVEFDATSDKGTTDASAPDEDAITKDGVTISISNGCLGLGTHYRIYKTSTITVSSTAGDITGIEFTCTANGAAKYGPGCFTTETGSYTYETSGTTGTWSGSASSITFTASSNQVRATKIVVTVGGSSVYVQKPSFTPAAGTYVGSVTVSLSAGDGASIYYTLDGSDPTTNSTAYTAPFTLSETATVKAIAADEDENLSDIVSATYKIRPEQDTIYAKAFAAEDSLNDFTVDNKTMPEDLTYVWIGTTTYGAKASAYANSTKYETESWLISPEISLAGYKDTRLFFDHAARYFSDAASELFVKVRATDSEEWKNLTVNYPTGSDWNFYAASDYGVSLADYDGKTIQVAFVYTSSASAAATWEIKNFLVSGTKDSTVGISNAATTSNAAAKMYDLQGRRVSSAAKGLYIINGKKVLVK